MRILLATLLLLAGCTAPMEPVPGSDEPAQDAPASRSANWDAFGLHDDPALGDRNATVTVVVFDAPKCGACALWHLHGLPDLEAKYIEPGHAVFVFVQSTIGYSFDFDGGRAMECAYVHGAAYPGGADASYKAYADAMFADQSNYREATVRDFLRSHAADHLDAQALVDCYDSGETTSSTQADFDVRADTGSTGQTPVFQVFADGEPIKTNTRGLSDAIDALLA